MSDYLRKPFETALLNVFAYRVIMRHPIKKQKSKQWMRNLATLSAIQRNPESADPTTLNRIADAYLAGEKSYEYPWVSATTLKNRQRTEMPIGGGEHMTRYPIQGAFSALGPGGERSKRQFQRSFGTAIC